MLGGAVAPESSEASLGALAARRGSLAGALGRAGVARFTSARRSVGSAISISRPPSSFAEVSSEGATSPGPGQGSRNPQRLSMSPTPTLSQSLSTNVFQAITDSAQPQSDSSPASPHRRPSSDGTQPQADSPPGSPHRVDGGAPSTFAHGAEPSAEPSAEREPAVEASEASESGEPGRDREGSCEGGQVEAAGQEDAAPPPNPLHQQSDESHTQDESEQGPHQQEPQAAGATAHSA